MGEIVHGNLEAPSWMREGWDLWKNPGPHLRHVLRHLVLPVDLPTYADHVGSYATRVSPLHQTGMPNIEQLDRILKAHTAVSSWADMLATSPSYIPTLDIDHAPELIYVAICLVEAGRDAYFPGHKFAKRLGLEILRDMLHKRCQGMDVLSTALKAESGPVPEAAGDEDDGMDADDVEQEIKYNLYYEASCDQEDPPEFCLDEGFDTESEALTAAQRIASREHVAVRICEEIYEQGEVAASETVRTVGRDR